MMSLARLARPAQMKRFLPVANFANWTGLARPVPQRFRLRLVQATPPYSKRLSAARGTVVAFLPAAFPAHANL
jgi:hypothetical protein